MGPWRNEVERHACVCVCEVGGSDFMGALGLWCALLAILGDIDRQELMDSNSFGLCPRGFHGAGLLGRLNRRDIS